MKLYEVAARLNWSATKVIRADAELRPARDERGERVYDAAVVERFAQERDLHPRRDVVRDDVRAEFTEASRRRR